MMLVRWRYWYRERVLAFDRFVGFSIGRPFRSNTHPTGGRQTDWRGRTYLLIRKPVTYPEPPPYPERLNEKLHWNPWSGKYE